MGDQINRIKDLIDYGYRIGLEVPVTNIDDLTRSCFCPRRRPVRQTRFIVVRPELFQGRVININFWVLTFLGSTAGQGCVSSQYRGALDSG